MWRSLVLVLFAFVLMTGSGVTAQTASEFRLVQPDMTSYLDIVRTLLNDGEPATSASRTAIVEHVVKRFGFHLSSAPYETLRALSDAIYFDDEVLVWNHKDTWERAMLLSWLRERSINLEEADRIQADDYNLIVTPIDFNGDGDYEYIVDVIRGCQSTDDPTCRERLELRGVAKFSDYVVIDTSEQHEIRVVSTPLPWLELGRSSDYSYLYPISLRDLNADGLPEWVFIGTFCCGGWGETAIRLYVLGWRDGEIRDLSAEEIRFNDPRGCMTLSCASLWTIEPPSEYGQSTIRQRMILADNWGCEIETVTLYEWADGQLTSDQTGGERRLPRTFACLMRTAEDAIMNGLTEAAVYLYEAALELEAQQDYVAYTRVRLAIAYALLGRLQDAHSELEAVSRLPTLPEQHVNDRSGYNTIPELVDALLEAYEQSPTAENLCLAAHRFVTEEPLYLYAQLSLVAGRVEDNFAEREYPPVYPNDVLEMGCLVEALLAREVGRFHFFTQETEPPQTLANAGWPGKTSFHADLNGDGIDEWLIWIDAQSIAPILVMSTPYGYEAALWKVGPGSGDEYPPDDDFTIRAVELPDGTTALATLDYVGIGLLTASLRQYGGGPQCENGERDGDLSLWRLMDSLTKFFSTVVCGDGSIDDFFSPHEVQGISVIERPNDFWSYSPSTYRWDAERQTYVVSEVPPETSIPITTSEPPAYPQSDFFSAVTAYALEDYQNALSAIEDLLSFADTIPTEIALGARYLHAVILEQLNRSGEALAGYVAVYESAPESAWGVLAQLHIEPMDASS